LRWYNNLPVLFLEGVDDRSAAESLIKAILIVEQEVEQLPPEPDAWYDHQLVGLKVFRDGQEIGSVVRVDHLPAQDLLVIKTLDKEVLLPFVKAFVPTVDVSNNRIGVTPPGGLFEDLEDDQNAN
jgi:16S rRNA processing protein RimM